MIFKGTTRLDGGCSLASNGTFSPPPGGQFTFTGGPWSVVASGGCTSNDGRCDLSAKLQSFNYSALQTPLPPALVALEATAWPAEPNKPAAITTPTPTTTTTWQGNFTVAKGAVVTLAAGVYMFDSLVVDGTLKGNNVNIIVGSGGLDGKGSLQITAGTGGAGAFSSMNGVLIFDLEGKGAAKTPDVKFTGQFNSNFNGAVYSPYSHLTFRGQASQTGCMIVVAKVLDFGGNSSLDTSGCSDSILSNVVGQAKVVLLTK
jgi:hypothetical protein